MSEAKELAVGIKSPARASSSSSSSSLPLSKYDQEKRKEFFRNILESNREEQQHQQKQLQNNHQHQKYNQIVLNSDDRRQHNVLMENDFSYIDEDGGDEVDPEDKHNNRQHHNSRYTRSNSLHEINFDCKQPNCNQNKYRKTSTTTPPSTPVKLKIVTIKYDSPNISNHNSNSMHKNNISSSSNNNNNNKNNNININNSFKTTNIQIKKTIDDKYERSPNTQKSESNVRNEIEKFNKIHSASATDDNKRYSKKQLNLDSEKISNKINTFNNLSSSNSNSGGSNNDISPKSCNTKTDGVRLGKRSSTTTKDTSTVINYSNVKNLNSNKETFDICHNSRHMNESNNNSLLRKMNKSSLKASETSKSLGAIPKDTKNCFNIAKQDPNAIEFPSGQAHNKLMKIECDDNANTQSEGQNSMFNKPEKYITQNIRDQLYLDSKIFADISDLEEDPYIVLQEYLEKVKREINDVFEEYQAKNNHLIEHNMDPMDAEKLRKIGMSERNCDEINKLKLLREESRAHLKNKEVKDVNLWANKIIQELDSLVATNEDESNKLRRQQMSKAINIRPEKRATIPLQSFNLLRDTPSGGERVHSTDFSKIQKRFEALEAVASPSAPSILNSVAAIEKCTDAGILRIEEGTENDKKMESTSATSPIRNAAKSSPILMKLNKKEKTLPNNGSGSCSSSGYSSSSATKKGSSSMIWTSDESILRSNNVTGVDDEIKSTTSSSVCDDGSGGILSSGKSGNSLDSSELENEIPMSYTSSTAHTPSSFAMATKQDEKLKFTKENSFGDTNVVDDPDLLEVLSLYDGVDVNNGENENRICQNYDDIDCLDGINDTKRYLIKNCSNRNKVSMKQHQSAAESNRMQNRSEDAVILRKKPADYVKQPNEKQRHAITASLPMKNSRMQKARSYIIESKKFSVSNKDIVKHSCSKDSIIDSDAPASRQQMYANDSDVSTNIREMTAESSASLHSGNENLSDMIELTAKSNSAPLLIKDSKSNEDAYEDRQNTLRYSRSQSDRHLAEIEAIEACKWLRAAGFPQYAQMYEDLQFPIDLSNVAKDHPILENDPLQSLYRRLCILNRCAALRLDSAYHHKPQQNQKDDSDDENFALSDQWTFQPQIRRWSRIGEIGLELPAKATNDKGESSSKESSPERFGDDDEDEFDSRKYSVLPQNSSDSSKTDSDSMSRLKRTGSERLKDGAKAFLRRVESIKTRRKKRQNRDGFVMSGGTGNRNRGPQVLELPSLDHTKLSVPTAGSDKSHGINITYSTPPSPSAVSPIHFYPRTTNIVGNDLKVPTVDSANMFLHANNRLSPKHIPVTPRTCHSSRTSPLHFFSSHMPHLREGVSDDSAAYMSDSQDSNADTDRLTEMKKIASRPRRFLQKCKVDDIGAHSDSECHATACRKFIVKELSTTAEHSNTKSKKLSRGGSLNLGKESKKYRESFQNRSFRSRGSLKKSGKETDEERSKKPVVRWHSFQNHEKPVFFKKCISPTSDESKLEGTAFAAMSCGQLEMVRKLALVTLTGYMERYCPSHRTGWNWELPKFIKKIKAPDYKDKKIFGVPLVLILQRHGKSLPLGISTALRWLRLNALEQIGIFRKSGVKSRIMKLKESIETAQSFEGCMDIFDNQQAFDVADVLKQYFRELPDSLLTAKMSETFVAIFQHLPQDIRIEAIQAAVLLLPDENRDVLFALLAFLHDVAKKSNINQMTASNLAVCLAPSLFNSNIATGNAMAVSPRRRKLGQPNMKELAETKASHECLTLMIEEYKKIMTASPDKVMKCNFSYMEESKPVPLEQLGEGMQYYNWRGYLYECTKATIKEGREKSRGWVAINSLDANIEIAYKKVGDGHLLRLWRCLTEVEGPPTDVLNFILNERNVWDNNLVECHEVKKLDEKTQIYYYSLDGQIPTDFCVLRSWQINNLPKQACVIVETSIDHRDAPQTSDSVRGVVLASRYLIEPCGSGRSRVMHLSRVDLKGKRPEWYNKNYGHICSQYLSNVRSAFRHVADGPESKV